MQLEQEMEAQNFWEDMEHAQKVMKEVKNLKDTVSAYRALQQKYDDAATLIEIGYEENDAELLPEIEEGIRSFEAELEDMRIRTLLSGEYDRNNAILRLNAGAGGTEACDWVGMLYRMYCRWAENKGFSVETLDYLDGEEAGLKSVTIQVNGENAFGYLKSERGVHRLVRISPFTAAGQRQT